MDKIIIPGPPVVGVIAGQTATADFPIGPRYHAIHLIAKGTGTGGATVALADVLGLIKVKVNSKTQREFTATELDAIQTHYGAEFACNIYAAGVETAAQANGAAEVHICINFSEPWRMSNALREMYALPTAWPNRTQLQSLQLSIDVPNTGNCAAGTIAITTAVEIDYGLGVLDSKNNPVTLFTKWYRRGGIQYSAAGDLTLTNLPKNDTILQLSMFAPSADPISAVKVKVDNIVKRDATKTMIDQVNINRGFNEAGIATNRFDLAFDYSDNPLDGLDVSQSSDFQVIPYMATANANPKTVVIIDQRYGPLD